MTPAPRQATSSILPAAHNKTERRRTGARAAAQALVENGVTDLFGIHGYINPVIEEACVLGARMWHFRHEQSAGFAADAYARVLRRPGVCFASASAGMANYLGALSQGVGALSPIVLLVGQHGTAGDRLETLQEGYAAECFKSVAKWTHRCTDWELNAFWVRKALMDAMTYPAGPVVLEFPLNTQFGFGPQPQRKYVPGIGLPDVPKTQADPARVEAVVDRLLAAQRPLLVAGDGLYWSGGADTYRQLAEFLSIPASARRTARGAMPEDHALAYKASYRRRLFEEADLIVLVGMRAGELESWFEAPDWPRGEVEYIQINETPGELWLGLPSAHMLVGSASLVLQQILDAARTRRGGVPVAREAWITTLAQARERNQSRHKQSVQAHADHTPIRTAELCQAIADVIDKDATVIYDSYSGSLYLSEMLTAHFPGQILDAGPRVALGQGVGMAFGAALARPGKQIITLVGDGGIGLSGMDVETFSRYGVPAVVVVLNNSSWGGNALARTEIQPGIGSWDMTPGLRYDAVMQPLGCHVEHVERSADLRPALQRALASCKVAVVNVVADTDGTGVSLPWLRLKIGEFWSRGIDDLPASVIKHFHAVSPLEALRLQKTARDNGTNIDLAFMSAITGHSEQVLRDLADKLSYSQT
jgi:acetolactate synthase I/II/III large subunit